MIAVSKGRRPEEPGPEAYDLGFTDSLWDLTQQCWRRRPQARPSANDIMAKLEES